MCGRYNFEASEEFYKRYHIANKIKVESNYNIAPGQLHPTVVQHSPNSIEVMYWGLIPFWEEDKPNPKGLINVRDDSITSKKWADRYIKFQRCIIPASGFYEWQKTAGGKQPYNIRLKDKKYFSLAGMYSSKKEPETGQEVHAYTIITTSANSLMEPIHNRMPVILSEEDEEYWLNPDNAEKDDLVKLLKPFKSDKMEAYPVANWINSPLYNDKKALDPLLNSK